MATQTVKPVIQIGDEIREMSEAELAQYEIDQAAAQAQATAQAAKAAARQAVLDKLGLTADEAAALLG
jgi:hypothetical protein